MATFHRLVRFIPQSDASVVLIGQPLRLDVDVGLATFNAEEVKVDVFTGSTVLHPGQASGRIEAIGQLLSPLSEDEVGAIRLIGLNYKQHALEVKLPFPKVPEVFMKPPTSLMGPWPERGKLPKVSQANGTADYEAELCVVIGKECKNVSEADALSYVLGYTAANDVSNRTTQFEQSQWCYSKGFDKSCPIGPVLVSSKLLPDPSTLHIRGIKNKVVMQSSPLKDLIFAVPRLVSYLSQGTTLKPGTIILTGTPAGVGHSFEPKEYLREGDEYTVEILPYVGSLITVFDNE